MSNTQSSVALLSDQDVNDVELDGGEEMQSTSGPNVQTSSRAAHPAFLIMNWIFLSNLTIIFNKWILDSAGFTMLLTCWHLVFATLATQLLARTTSLLRSRKTVNMTASLYARTICPIGIFYSASLVCSNLVYLYLSVAFIQMLKSAAPIAVLLVSWAWRVEQPSLVALVKVLIIVLGVALASAGEVQMSLIGFLFQVGGLVFEAIRLVMIQVMLGDRKMDPLVGLYYYAPVCALITMIIAMFSELPRLQWQDVTQTGFGVLFANAFVAFLLNVASVFLIRRTSGLVVTLSGVLKNVLLIIASVLIWHTTISLMQVIGYSIALAGLVYYSFSHEDDWLSRNIKIFSQWILAMIRQTSLLTESKNPL